MSKITKKTKNQNSLKVDGKPKQRKLGLSKGQIWMAPDAFSPETDAKIARLIYDGALKED